MVDRPGVWSLVGKLGRSDAEVEEPLCAELDRLFACPQVRRPAPDAKIFFNLDSKRQLQQQRGNQRGLRVTLWSVFSVQHQLITVPFFYTGAPPPDPGFL